MDRRAHRADVRATSLFLLPDIGGSDLLFHMDARILALMLSYSASDISPWSSIALALPSFATGSSTV